MHPRRFPLSLLHLLLASLLWSAPARALKLDDSWGLTANTPLSASLQGAERKRIRDYLRAMLGAPYRLGASGGVAGFDCSGLVLRAYEAAGLTVPRLSAQQARIGVPAAADALQPGDLLFYRMQASQPDRLHVVVYIGDGRAIHASVKHGEVREIDITRPIWSSRLVAARTLL